MLEYLIVMLIFTLPFISYVIYKKRFRALILAAVMGLLIGVPWDTISACYFNTWFWNKDTLIGVWMRVDRRFASRRIFIHDLSSHDAYRRSVNLQD